jgi:hypothetical protein
LSICLTKKEINELTLKMQHSAQVRVLAKMEIRYTLRPDGSPVVLRSSVERVMESHDTKSSGPDFSSLNQ